MINRTVLGVLALVAGACLAVVGSVQRLYRVAYDFGTGFSSPDGTLEIEYTSWTRHHSPTSPGSIQFDATSPPRYGIPVAAAAVLLLVCAVLLLLAGRAPARAVAVARFGAVGGAMLLLGAVWSVGQSVWSVLSEGGGQLTVDVGAGLWVMAVGGGVALAGALLVQQLPSRPDEPTGPVIYQLEDDTDTPPLGFPVLVVEQQEDTRP